MLHRNSAAVPWGILLGCLVLCFALFPANIWGQQTQGTISVTVTDPTGGVIPGAQLKLVDVATNDARAASSLENGTYSFVNLKIGSYKLTVSRTGFNTQVYSAEVMAGRITDLKAVLQVGKTEEVVEVQGSVTPLVEASSNAINMTIAPEQIENLPLSGRNISAMSKLSAGYNGTWNGLSTEAQGNSIDGVIGASGRWKYSAGADSAAITPRLESIAEMTVSTNQLDLNSGFGTSNMIISYITRRGTNDFHGRLFEDFRNSALNATSPSTRKKSKLILNEFGGSAGGALIKDKLFFFGSFSMSKRPGNYDANNVYFSPAAQSGVYNWQDDNGKTHSVNLLDAAKAYNTANAGTTGFVPLPTTVNSMISSQFSKINGSLSQGSAYTIPGSADLNLLGLTWKQTSPITYYYPTARFDYNLSQKHRLYFSYNQTRMNQPNSSSGWWPGDSKTGNYKSDALTAALGLESTLTPTLINQFKLGYLYSAAFYPSNDTSYFDSNAQIVNWGYYLRDGWDDRMGGMNYNLPTSREQPVVNIADDMTWMKGKHTIQFGFSAYRDANTYWDAPAGTPTLALGINALDPAASALTKTSLATDGVELTDSALSNARQLYAVLTGRVNSYTGQNVLTASHAYTQRGQFAYNKLSELMKSYGLYIQDSYKALPNLTVNYGLRWDFVGTNQDTSNRYHSMSDQDMWAVSGVWNLFNPGSMKGISDPVASVRKNPYDPWKVTPQPAVGLAWTPRSNGTLAEKLLGGDKTVVRAGYSLRRFTEPQQFVWDSVSNYSTGLFQNFSSYAGSTNAPGYFVAGSKSLGDVFPDYAYAPETYANAIHMSDYTFQGGAYSGIDQHIRQPYTQSWNLGFQRDIGGNRAIEVRYVGNRTIHQWLGVNINEANIFENGFLKEFQAAQNNLKLNGGTSFAPGTAGAALPIMTAAGVNFTNPDFITQLKNGDVGSMASTLTGSSYFCNLVGSSFGPCATAGLGGSGKGYALNFWQANPYADGAWITSYVTDQGYSNYNSLQLELRQQQWHGLNYTVNYTWSKTLGVATSADWTGGFTQWTARNISSSYAPAGTDRQHVIHFNATYDLPFGKGKQFLNRGGIVDSLLGGWTIATIYQFTTGAPFRIGGQYDTYNNLTDGGVVLNGVTASDIQKHVGIHLVPSSNSKSASAVYFIDPAYAKSLIADGKIVSNTTPGTIGTKLWLHGPHQTTDDISISKSIRFNERMRFKLQGEFINAFNHQTYVMSSYGIGNANSFGRGTWTSGYQPRQIELRANFEF